MRYLYNINPCHFYHEKYTRSACSGAKLVEQSYLQIFGCNTPPNQALLYDHSSTFPVKCSSQQFHLDMPTTNNSDGISGLQKTCSDGPVSLPIPELQANGIIINATYAHGKVTKST